MKLYVIMAVVDLLVWCTIVNYVVTGLCLGFSCSSVLF